MTNSIGREKEKKKIVHIHTDGKFIHSVKSFEGGVFQNVVVKLGKKDNFNQSNSTLIQYFNYSRRDIKKIIRICSSADLVILYNLDFVKAYIANRINSSVVVMWRLFGTELYKNLPEFVFGPKTLELLQSKNSITLTQRFKNGLKKEFTKYKYLAIPEQEIERAIKIRIDYIASPIKEEYGLLKNYYPFLPKFFHWNLIPLHDNIFVNKRRSNKIIIGNNRSAYNNHLEILEEIKTLNHRKDLEFILLFNYGQENYYTSTILEKANEISEMKIISEFLPYEALVDLYNNVDAFALNGHRQMALGNITLALQKNVKIYLNEKNILYQSLRREGFHVFSIKSFHGDAKNGYLTLTKQQIEENQRLLSSLAKKRNRKNFHSSIINLLESSVNKK